MPINAKSAAVNGAQATLGGKGINEWRARQEAARRAAAIAQSQMQLGPGAASTGGLVPTGNIPVPTGNLPVPTGNLPVAQQFNGPFGNAATQAATATVGGNQQLALGAGQAIPGGAPQAAQAIQGAPGAGAATADLSKYALNEAEMTGAGGAGAGAAGNVGNGLTGWRAIAAKTPFISGQAAAQTAFAPGTIGRGGLYALGGQVAGGLFDRAVGERDGTWDDAAGSALRWGGAGAGIGSMIAPGPGTLIGGAIGAGIGATKGLLTGEDSQQTQVRDYFSGQLDAGNKDSLIAKFDKYGITGDTRNNLLMQIDLLGAQVETKEQAKQLVTQIVSSIPDIVSQQQQQQATQARSAAIQSYLQPMIQQQLAMYNQSNQQASDLATQGASQIGDPALAAIYKSHAQQLLSSGNSAGLGYLQQMAVAPQLYGQSATDPSLYAGANAQMPQQSNAYQDAYLRALGTAQGKAGATSAVPSYSP